MAIEKGIGRIFSPEKFIFLQVTVRSLHRLEVCRFSGKKFDHLSPVYRQLSYFFDHSPQFWDYLPEVLQKFEPTFLTCGPTVIPLEEFRQVEVLNKYAIKIDVDVLNIIETASKHKEIIIVAKLFWGDAREKLCEAVGDLKLDPLVIGSRGLGTIQMILLGSVSKFVMTHAPCPVTIVKEHDVHNN